MDIQKATDLEYAELADIWYRSSIYAHPFVDRSFWRGKKEE
ncbi:hypothetical protein [Bacillus sp. Marseille-P3800]|nr:hypothetical protein [Bacillus sp. Marseille-P3800]